MKNPPSIDSILAPFMGRTAGDAEESHNLDSLSKRTCLAPEILSELIEGGHLAPTSNVSAHTPSSPVRFSAADLDHLRYLVLSEIVAHMLNACDDDGIDDDDQRLAAVRAGLEAHTSNFASPFNRRTVELAAKEEDDGPSALGVIGGATLATGALAAGAYARGRWQQRVNGLAPRVGGKFVPKTAVNTMRQGAGLLAGDARRAATAAGQLGRKAIGAFRAS